MNLRCAAAFTVAVAGAMNTDSPVAPNDVWTEPSSGIELVTFPPGEFDMGSPDDEPGREPQERLHRVKLTRGFSIARYETTQAQWSRVMGANPSHFPDCGTACPVERVSLHDVERFIDRLNARAANPGFRLPTEAEWEYACRAGGRAAFGHRANISRDDANYNGEFQPPGTPKAPARGRPMPVGSFPANPWRLFDMHGNVWEWTSDRHCPYSGGPVSDPSGHATANAALYEAAAFTSTQRAPAAASATRIAHRIRASASASASPTPGRRNDYS